MYTELYNAMMSYIYMDAMNCEYIGFNWIP